jgi:hypothetical protein
VEDKQMIQIVVPGPGAFVRWRETVYVETVPILTPFMLYVFNNGGIWHRQPVAQLHMTSEDHQVGYYQQLCYFGEEGKDAGHDYQIVALLSRMTLPGELFELPANIYHSNVVPVTRR